MFCKPESFFTALRKNLRVLYNRCLSDSNGMILSKNVLIRSSLSTLPSFLSFFNCLTSFSVSSGVSTRSTDSNAVPSFLQTVFKALVSVFGFCLINLSMVAVGISSGNALIASTTALGLST